MFLKEFEKAVVSVENYEFIVKFDKEKNFKNLR